MNPPPIRKAKLAEILNEATALLPPEVSQRYSDVKVTPYQVRVRYNEVPQNEHAFWVVGIRDRKLLMYDDVEEYFSVGALDNDGILRRWENLDPQDRLDGAIAELVAGDRG